MSKNHWVNANDKLRIQEILDSFDFNKVKTVLDFLSPDNIADIKELQISARYLLEYIFERGEKDILYYNDDFFAIMQSDNTIYMNFSIEGWKQRQKDSFAICTIYHT